MRVLVTGATGLTGSAVLDELRARDGIDVVAATRDPRDRGDGATGGDVEWVRFDFTDPATYDAFDGVDAVYLVRPPTLLRVRRDVFPAIDAMERAGVARVVFLSVLGAQRNPLLPHRHVERRIEDSLLTYTFLRAADFMQNLTTVHRDVVREENAIDVPAGDGETGFVDVRDVAAVAALALCEPGHGNRAYDLTGPEALTFHEVATTLSAVLDRPVTYRDPSIPAFVRRALARGTDPGLVVAMSVVYSVTRLGLAARVTDTVPRVLGREATPFERFARDYRAHW